MKIDALSFAGCGTLNFYQTGAAAALQQAGLTEGVMYAGASAGSGLSVMLASGIDARQIHTKAVELLSPHQGKNILKHPDMLREFATTPTISRCRYVAEIADRVHISITSLRPFRNQLIIVLRIWMIC